MGHAAPECANRPRSLEKPRKNPASSLLSRNLPVPFDRRVWLEMPGADLGWLPGVCGVPQGPRRAVLRGHRLGATVQVPALRARRQQGQPSSPSTCTRFLATGVGNAQGQAFPAASAVIQACNPPRHLLAAGPGLPRARGNPLRIRPPRPSAPSSTSRAFPSGPKLPYKGLLALERRTHQAANHVILHE